MSYKHGVYTSEIATALVPPVSVDSSIPLVIGTAPVHIFDEDERNVNKLILANSYSEAVSALGYTDDWTNFTLCEFMKSQFSLYGYAPVMFINVFDPNIHKKEIAASDSTFENDEIVLSGGIIKGSSSVKSKDTEPVTYEEGVDYLEDCENSKITRIDGGGIAAGATVSVSYSAPDLSLVDASEIVGGVDAEANLSGLELVNQAYSEFGLLPGMIVAPGFSKESSVAAVMTAKAKVINTLFSCMAVIDIDDTAVTKYSDAVKYKNDNNLTDPCQIVCWPKVKLGDNEYHLSTQICGVIAQTDAAKSGVPSASPSNKRIQIDSAVANGNVVWLLLDQANYLNGQGIVTVLNFSGGWKLWGNRTGCYPSNTDPKDAFINVRRMFKWVGNTLILTFWSKIDENANRRFVETILESSQIWLDGLVPEDILGALVEFRDDENQITDMMDGVYKFHVSMTPASPGRVIEFIQEYDPSYFNSLF